MARKENGNGFEVEEIKGFETENFKLLKQGGVYTLYNVEIGDELILSSEQIEELKYILSLFQ